LRGDGRDAREKTNSEKNLTGRTSDNRGGLTGVKEGGPKLSWKKHFAHGWNTKNSQIDQTERDHRVQKCHN